MMSTDLMYVDRECPFCGECYRILVREVDFAAWQGGELVQDAFSYLSAGEREILLSGICPTCWAESFGEEDEDPDPGEEW